MDPRVAPRHARSGKNTSAYEGSHQAQIWTFSSVCSSAGCAHRDTLISTSTGSGPSAIPGKPASGSQSLPWVGRGGVGGPSVPGAESHLQQLGVRLCQEKAFSVLFFADS